MIFWFENENSNCRKRRGIFYVCLEQLTLNEEVAPSCGYQPGKQMKFKTIGILGGMGPEASANLYQRIIKYAQIKYGAVQDDDYPPIIIYSLPLDGFDEKGINNLPLVKEQLVNAVKRLELAGSELIVIACNTVHHFYSAMQDAVTIPILNIVEKSLSEVKKESYKKIGLFSSQSTVELKLYQLAFEKSGIKVILPNKNQQEKINMVIEKVMGGRQGIHEVIMLKEIAFDFVQQGAQAIVMGCTEIPLALNQTHTDIKLFDTIEIIVEAAVDFSRKNELIINTQK